MTPRDPDRNGPADPWLAEAPRAVLLADVVYDRIRRAIVQGDYAEDERLPGENSLATQFDVSRPVVRAALKRLRDEGLITSRQGSGSYVSATVAPKTLAFQRLETIADLQRCYEFRLTIEPAAAALAAIRRSESALAEISNLLQLLRDATERQSHREDADFSFHLAITATSNNQYFETSMRALKDHIAVGMKFHGLSLRTVRGGLDHVLEEHTAIFTAIKDGKADAAHDAMKRHVEGSRDRLFEGRLLDLSSR
ncbi:MAG: FadR/GntR family transcriptional regulator [Pseudotabrizicola sp.]|uniref:FadR/GntR family transcriptional regulator n=1 Tax=Pseudotabrizicola sp. TaxID=2939647 RepID=UPI00272EE915|nr:FadR/GntR family transcriptional regulator [Pseudotabrizicola sp.]MDP2082470.1 FadR/GntR family transcriptional regulator [Pseudotabrizicola sp.]MDZ7572776.1 FadR/GntR family transcriptional regulator [Pseudotabrizicola sp.]